jgi:uncharacterized protein (UPF0548 family)
LFTIKDPTPEDLRSILKRQENASFSYPEVGASSQDRLPSGYNIDRSRIGLGSGESTFAAAKNALQRWQMFEMPGVRIFPKNAEICKDSMVAIVAEHFGFHSVNVCRIVDVAQTHGPLASYSFAYGTLPEHAATGEERFTILWDQNSDLVSYEILAFSKPRATLAKIGYPLSRLMQRRFAQGSLQAMARSVPRAGTNR